MLKYHHLTRNRRHEAVAGLPTSPLPANFLLADLGTKSPSSELLQKVRLTGPWVPLQMIADQSTWCNSRWSGVSYTHNARLFSMSSGPIGRDWHGPVVKFVTWNSSGINSVQQSRKCNLLISGNIACIPER